MFPPILPADRRVLPTTTTSLRTIVISTLLVVVSPPSRVGASGTSSALDLFTQFASRRTSTGGTWMPVSDIVLLVDRSTSVGRLPYHLQTLPFLHSLVRDHLSNSRVAVVGFNGEAATLYDEISGDTWISRCAFLQAARPTFAPRQRTRIADALRLADQLLTVGRSRGRRLGQGRLGGQGRDQAVLLISDAAYRSGVDESPDLWSEIVKDRGGVKIYAVKVGVWAEVERLKSLTSDGNMYYEDILEWRHLGKYAITSYANGQNRNVSNFAPTYVKDEASTCNSPCHAHSECQCDILRGVSQCMCFPGYYEVDHSCTRCPDNTFKSETGNQACTKCPTSCDTCQGSSEVRISVDQCGCGSKCQDPCDGKTCGHNEACRAVDGECACLDGWTGAGCSVNRNDCADNLCQNGATCLDMVNDYACICPWGFLGRFCEINFDECSYDLCSKYTINCIDLVNKFKCNCTNPNDKSLFCTDNEITSTKSAYTTTAFTSVDPKLPTITTAGAATAATTTLTPPTGSSSATDETSAPTTSTKNDDTTTSTATDPNTSSDVTTNGGIVTGTSHKPTAGPVKNSGTDKKIYIIIAAVALALIIFAIVIVCCLMARRKNHREDDKSAVAIYESGVTADLPRNPDGTVEKNFYGLWKKNTIKGISEVYPYQSNGTRNLAYTSDGVEGDNRGLNRINEIYMNNADTTVSTPANMTTVGPDKDVMEGWKTYLSQLTDKNVVESAIIVKPDGSSRAKTDSWIINHSEIKKLTAILDEQQVNVAAHAQCCEFHITYNEEGCSAGGRSFDGLLCLRICRTNDYLLAAVCVSGNDTDQQCRKELEWIADHIKAEGY